MSENKLILISDNSDKTRIRYRKKNDTHWQTIYLDNGDYDTLIDQLLAGINKDGNK